MATTDSPVEVFADVLCPFAHVGIRRLVEARLERRGSESRLRVRAWPLEIINDAPPDTETLGAEIDALRSSVAPDLFVGFDPATFPTTALPAFAVAAAAYRTAPWVGEAVNIDLRNRLWEHGQDVADPDVLAEVCEPYDFEVIEADRATIDADHDEGVARGVVGSPYFFADGTGFFCPAFTVSHDDAGFHVTPDQARYAAFINAALS